MPHRDTIGNVDLIIDANHHNENVAFDAEMARARADGGRFRAVNQIARLGTLPSVTHPLTTMPRRGHSYLGETGDISTLR